MSNKKQTAVDWLINELHKKQNGEATELSYNHIFDKAKQLEAEQSIICKDCGEVINVEEINNHSFIKIKGGGLIHWNCK